MKTPLNSVQDLYEIANNIQDHFENQPPDPISAEFIQRAHYRGEDFSCGYFRSVAVQAMSKLHRIRSAENSQGSQSLTAEQLHHAVAQEIAALTGIDDDECSDLLAYACSFDPDVVDALLDRLCPPGISLEQMLAGAAEEMYRLEQNSRQLRELYHLINARFPVLKQAPLPFHEP